MSVSHKLRKIVIIVQGLVFALIGINYAKYISLLMIAALPSSSRHRAKGKCEVKIVELKTKDLKPYEKNAKKHDKRQIDNVALSIKKYGFKQPVVVDSNNVIVIGHCRVLAAKQLKLETVPCVLADDLTPEQIKELRIIDNKTNESEWDIDLLTPELAEIDLSDFDLDFGGDETEAEAVEDDFDVDAAIPEEPIAKLGDIWQLGEHRLMCGDSTNSESVARLMGGVKADMVFTDPPYNVDYSNADRPKASKTDLGRIKNDVMDADEFIIFLGKAFSNLDKYSKEDSAFYIWYASNTTLSFLLALKETSIEHNQQIIWKKPMLLGRGKYQWAHEPCIFGIKGKPYHTKDRTKTTVWDFGGYDKSKNVHPTQKPLILVSEAIQNSSKREDVLLDLFGGSGSTLMACEQLKRKCFMMELDPKYCDVIIARYEKFTGNKAVKL